MKHLLIIHQAFSSLNDTGGTRHFEFAKHLIRSGSKVTVVTSGMNYLTAKKASYHDKATAASSEPTIVCAPTLNLWHKSFAGRVIAFLSFMISSTVTALRMSKVDLVMGTSPPIFQAFSAYAVAKLKRRPFLLEIRDLWPDFAIDIGILKNPILIDISRRAERFLYEHADHVLVNSPAYVSHVLEKGIPKEKVSLIPNGVDPDMFDPNENGLTFRLRFGLQGKFIVTYAGALGMANDIPTILRAARRLGNDSELVFVIVGDGKDHSTLEKWVHDEGLGNVIFTGPLPKSAIPAALAASDVCLATLKNIPMFRMTYPNKVFDYMAAGRPVVLAIDGVIREVVERAAAGLYVPPGDDQQLAAAIAHLKQDSDSRRKMGRSGRTFVEKHFNRRDHAIEFRSLIERLAN